MDMENQFNDYATGKDCLSMNMTEYHAMISYAKDRFADEGKELEDTLLRVKKQADKKSGLVDWIKKHWQPTGSAAALADISNAPAQPAPTHKRERQEESGGQGPAPVPAEAGVDLSLNVEALMDAYAAGKDSLGMNMNELRSIVEYAKENLGSLGHSLEDDLLKVKRQQDKKEFVARFVQKEWTPATPRASTAQRAAMPNPPAPAQETQMPDEIPPKRPRMEEAPMHAPPPPSASYTPNSNTISRIDSVQLMLNGLETSFFEMVDRFQKDLDCIRAQLEAAKRG